MISIRMQQSKTEVAPNYWAAWQVLKCSLAYVVFLPVIRAAPELWRKGVEQAAVAYGEGARSEEVAGLGTGDHSEMAPACLQNNSVACKQVPKSFRPTRLQANVVTRAENSKGHAAVCNHCVSCEWPSAAVSEKLYIDRQTLLCHVGPWKGDRVSTKKPSTDSFYLRHCQAVR